MLNYNTFLKKEIFEQVVLPKMTDDNSLEKEADFAGMESNTERQIAFVCLSVCVNRTGLLLASEPCSSSGTLVFVCIQFGFVFLKIIKPDIGSRDREIVECFPDGLEGCFRGFEMP